MNFKLNWDWMGIATSVLCAIHCAILPLIVSSLPLFGIDIIHHQMFEWMMIFIAFVIGSIALFHGYAKHHGSMVPAGLFFAGFLFLTMKQIFHGFEISFLIPAVLLIISAHLLNYRLCHKSRCRSQHHSH